MRIRGRERARARERTRVRERRSKTKIDRIEKAPGSLCIEEFCINVRERERGRARERDRENLDLCVYVAIASYCEKRHAYRDRCEIRHGPSKEK